MTQARRDNHSTEFGIWLREQPEIDSKLGYVATNIDYVWRNYKTGKWMLIEEKRYNSKPKYYQVQLFNLLNWCAKHHPKFMGFYLLIFEKTSPDDGSIYLNDKSITKHELLEFLKMETQEKHGI
jgi:hypothetical protein